MAETFEEFITRERHRLHAEREAVFTQQRELEHKLAGINRELAAIDAYEAAKTGKAPAARPAASRPAAPRARRGSKRERLLGVIRQHPDGLARKDIIERMGLKGDKTGEMSVSNALTALIKANQLTRRDGRYIAA
ncbi:MAG TPA: hypothetical protein VNF04_13845 [Stellaceae bacterium]|nr:hypothetical protein [Stellaceae bacterium]